MKVYLVLKGKDVVKVFDSYNRCKEFIEKQNTAILNGMLNSYERAIRQVDLRFREGTIHIKETDDRVYMDYNKVTLLRMVVKDLEE